jgi:mRNA interferase MazF
MIEKDYERWMPVKTKLHNANNIPAAFKEGDIWWCAFGENIGVEIDGKGRQFSRPVYVYKKLSREGFLGIPLTTQLKTGSWYVEFDFKGIKENANLAQIRVISSKRLTDKIGSLDDGDRVRIKRGFIGLYG